MKKTVLTFGLICGFIMIAMMTLTLVLSERIGYGHSLVLGYTILILGSLLFSEHQAVAIADSLRQSEAQGHHGNHDEPGNQTKRQNCLFHFLLLPPS